MQALPQQWRQALQQQHVQHHFVPPPHPLLLLPQRPAVVVCCRQQVALVLGLVCLLLSAPWPLRPSWIDWPRAQAVTGIPLLKLLLLLLVTRVALAVKGGLLA